MTIIAYKDGVLAADRLMTVNGGTIVGEVRKIARSVSGYVLGGAAGSAGYAAAFLKWILNEAPPGEEPTPKQGDGLYDRGILIRAADPNVIEVHEPDGTHTINVECYALGSGRELALGAMDFGATAEEAVAITIARETSCGGEVDFFQFAD